MSMSFAAGAADSESGNRLIMLIMKKRYFMGLSSQITFFADSSSAGIKIGFMKCGER